MKTRDFDIITHIKKYCIDIENTVNRFGNNLTCFSNDIDYRNSVCMSILQIGELTESLSDEFRRATKEIIYWPSVKGMRNVFAHKYGEADYGKIWETVMEDIPMLHEFCQEIITAHEDRQGEQQPDRDIEGPEPADD